MKQTLIYLSLLLFVCFFFSCSSKSEKKQQGYSSKKANHKKEQNEKEEEHSSEGEFEDGTYSATVDYRNSKTGHSATYTLDVDVEDGQVVQINFPNGGYVDDDHISPADLDEDGNASVDGENGKTYEVQIDE